MGQPFSWVLTLPNAVAYSLENKKDLGVHTLQCPMLFAFSGKGVITNRRKTFHPDVMLTSLQQDLRNYTNGLIIILLFISIRLIISDPYLIGKNNKMVAVNSALQVDLTGQINAESIGYKQFSHGGGQLDMMMGAFNSEGGKGIIARIND